MRHAIGPDTLLYLFLAIYVDNVFPGQYGIPQKWYYLCQPVCE
jgi:hypothetical protein